MELDKAIELVKEGIRIYKLKVEDKDILELAGKIFISSNIPSKTFPKESKEPNKATQRQIDTLYKLNADFDAETITKQEASKLLNKLLPKKK